MCKGKKELDEIAGRIIGIYEKYPPCGGFLDTTLLCVDGKNIFFSYDNRDSLFSIDVLREYMIKNVRTMMIKNEVSWRK